MQIYMVGGAVRDSLLGLPVKDRDWVVVGATPQQLVGRGFLPVGKDFPVFLHPESHEEYALARTERKTAPGYRGFVVHAAEDVTLEQDLARRDLTINAIAVAAVHVDRDGNFDPLRTPLIDPHHGQADLQSRVLRHVGDAFREDPVRILRLARFAARFANFDVAPETLALTRAMVAQGEVTALVAERVWQELARGLMEAAPTQMFRVLHDSGALAVLLPEIDVSGLHDPALTPAHCNGSGFSRLARVLDAAVGLGAPLPVRYASLCLHLQPGPAATAGTPATTVKHLSQRLRVPTECRELAETVTREQSAILGSHRLMAVELVRLLERCDAFRKPARFADMLLVCECDANAEFRSSGLVAFPQRIFLQAALAAARTVQTDAVAARAHEGGSAGTQVGEEIRQERAAAVAAMLQQQPT